MIKLNEHDRHRLQALLDDFSAQAQYPITLNKLLNTWRVFVAHVERGYPAGAYDYDNELSSRDLLQQLIEQGPLALQHELARQLEPWDARFRAATCENTEQCAHLERSTYWWRYRVPKKEVRV